MTGRANAALATSGVRGEPSPALGVAEEVDRAQNERERAVMPAIVVRDIPRLRASCATFTDFDQAVSASNLGRWASVGPKRVRRIRFVIGYSDVSRN